MGHKSRAKKRQNRASLTPATPRGHTSNATDTQSDISAEDSLLLISPFATPPTSPSSPSTSMVLQSLTVDQITPLEPTILSANDIVSTDIVAIADMFATMKKAMLMMTSAFYRFDIQTEKLASLSLDIKAAEQVRPFSIVIAELCRLILRYYLAESSAQSPA
jgi:hypothetical protein